MSISMVSKESDYYVQQSYVNGMEDAFTDTDVVATFSPLSFYSPDPNRMDLVLENVPIVFCDIADVELTEDYSELLVDNMSENMDNVPAAKSVSISLEAAAAKQAISSPSPAQKPAKGKKKRNKWQEDVNDPKISEESKKSIQKAKYCRLYRDKKKLQFEELKNRCDHLEQQHKKDSEELARCYELLDQRNQKEQELTLYCNFYKDELSKANERIHALEVVGTGEQK